MNGVLRHVRHPLFSLLVLGFALRLTGIDFGLPFLYHADEPIVVNHALAYGTGDLNPHFFKIPPLVSYLLFPLYGIYFLLGQLAGWFPDVQAFQFQFYRDPSVFYLIARFFFGVLPGTVSIFVFYHLIRRLSAFRETALTGAALLAVSFLHVRQSHYVYPDIPLVLVMLAVFFPLVRLARGDERWRVHLAAGALIGVAAAFKYNGAVLAVPYLYASWNPKLGRILPLRWVGAGLVSILVYLLLNPYTMLDFQFFIHEIRSQAAANTGVDWLHHLTYSLRGGMGMLLVGAALAGMVLLGFRKDRAPRMLAVFVLSYYGVLCLWGQPYARYGLPLIPPLLYFVAEFIGLAAAAFRRPARAVLVLTALMMLPSLAHSVLLDRVLLADDTRTLARKWMQEHIPASSRVAIEIPFYMPRLLMAPAQLEARRDTLDETFHAGAKAVKLEFMLQRAKQEPSYHLFELLDEPHPEGAFLFSYPRLPHDLPMLRAAGVEYVIMARLRKQDRNQDFYEALEKEGKLLAEFNPYASGRSWPYTHPLTGGPFLFQDLMERERNGQPIRIYRISEAV